MLADWGGVPVPPYYTPHEEAVAAEIDRLARIEGVDFVLSLGDHFYFSGITSVDDPRFKVSTQSKHTEISWIHGLFCDDLMQSNYICCYG